MIPTIDIDSRSYDEIFSEAMSLIPKYCPEWTNLNAGDPGITLLSLFSWMIESTLKRINRIPQKVYMALLDMLGFSIKAPKAATGIVKFLTESNLKDGEVVIPKGTQVGSMDLNSEGLLFSTKENIVMRNTELTYCFNRDSNLYRQVAVLNGNITPFSMFESENSVEYSLYFGSPVFETFQNTGSIVQISFEPQGKVFSVKDEIVNYFIWEYWNGDSWKEIKPTRIIDGEKQRDNVIYFSGPIEDIAKRSINNINQYYLKATLIDVPENQKVISVYDIKLKVYSDIDGVALENMTMLSSGFTSSIDTREPFRIFARGAQSGDAFYFTYDRLLGKPGVKVFLSYNYSQDYADNPNSHNISKFVDFVYEYFNGKKWIRLTNKANEFEDTTEGFKVDGEVSFVVPKDIQKTSFNSKEAYWIRLRIAPINYAYGGSYVKSDKDNKIVWDFDENLMMPEFEQITIKNAPFEQQFERIIAYDNFKYNNLDYFVQEHEGKQPIKLFNMDDNNLPGMYMGFSNVISRGQFNVYIKLDDSKKITKEDYIGNVFNYRTHSMTNADDSMLDLQWQVLTENGWDDCSVVDKTNKFSNSGFVEFVFRKDLKPQNIFGHSACWIRVIKRNGSFELNPYVENIVINCVAVENSIDYVDQTINYANLDESQNRYRITSGNLLQGVRLAVDEGRIPSNAEIKALRDDGIEEPYVVDGDRVWVEYKEVDNFYNSGVFSRHFVVNYSENTIYFGDGVNGVSPLQNGFGLKLLHYRTGGGKAGNLSSHKLQYLTRNFLHVAGCDNPFPCDGGSDIETIEDLRARSAGLLKSLDRAVTGEDFEWLACEASPAVARAHCAKSEKPGSVRLILVPRLPDRDYKKLLYPSRTLMNIVENYLNERKVIGVNVDIYPPYYRKFNINIDVIFSDIYFDHNAEKKKIIDHLLHFYNAVYGGVDGKGWPFERNITKSNIMKEVETIDSVVKIIKVDIFDMDKDAFVDELSINDSELPYLGDINVYDRYN